MQAACRKLLKKKELQSIVGMINHRGKAVDPTRLFMSRLMDSDVIPVDDQVKADLKWFEKYLPRYNGRYNGTTIIKTEEVDLVIEKDACLKIMGVHDQSTCYITHIYESMSAPTWYPVWNVSSVYWRPAPSWTQTTQTLLFSLDVMMNPLSTPRVELETG